MEAIKIEEREDEGVRCKVFKYKGCSRQGDCALLRAAGLWAGGLKMKDHMILSIEYGHDQSPIEGHVTYVRIYYV